MTPTERPLLIHAGMVIDGTGGPPARNVTLVIKDGRIDEVTATGATEWPEGAEAIDASDLTVLPGLIDCHDHLASAYDLERRWGLHEPASTRHVRTARVASQILMSGYTTVRDAGGLDRGLRLAIEEGLVPGPRLLVSVGIISSIGGIGDVISGSGHHAPSLGDPALPHGVANGVAGVRRAVRRMVRAGANVIKCATTGGASSSRDHGPKDPAFNRDELRALVDEAHALGRRVMCHALGGSGLRLAIEAGVDSIEHGCYLDEDPELITRMAECGIFLVPTLTVYEYHRRSVLPHVRQRALELYHHHIETVQRALSAGVKIAAGTDAGGHGHPNNAVELEHLVAAGLSPMQALRAATGLAAECLGLEQAIGTIQKDKVADLVLMEGNPLDDLRGLQDPRRIRRVIRDGVTVTAREPTALAPRARE